MDTPYGLFLILALVPGMVSAISEAKNWILRRISK